MLTAVQVIKPSAIPFAIAKVNGININNPTINGGVEVGIACSGSGVLSLLIDQLTTIY